MGKQNPEEKCRSDVIKKLMSLEALMSFIFGSLKKLRKSCPYVEGKNVLRVRLYLETQNIKDVQ